MTVSAIITAHDNWSGLVKTVRMLARQRELPGEVIALWSGKDLDKGKLDWLSSHVGEAIIRPNMNDWGHDKRATGLARAKGDYVAFFNDDDVYSSKYLATLLEVAQERNADIVACDFVSKYDPTHVALTMPAIGHITSGNFIVRRTLAQKVGYNHRHYEGDGKFIEDLMEAGATFARVPKVLYVHQ